MAAIFHIILEYSAIVNALTAEPLLCIFMKLEMYVE